MWEEMAKQSRKRINLFGGRQRGILAHENKGRNLFGPKTSLQDAGNTQMSSLFPREEGNQTTVVKQKPPSTAQSRRERHSVTTLQKPVNKLTIDHDMVGLGSGRNVRAKARYQTDKKPGPNVRGRSMVDVHIQREIEAKQRKLYQQMMHNGSVDQSDR